MGLIGLPRLLGVRGEEKEAIHRRDGEVRRGIRIMGLPGMRMRGRIRGIGVGIIRRIRGL